MHKLHDFIAGILAIVGLSLAIHGEGYGLFFMGYWMGSINLRLRDTETALSDGSA
jgi:hypothetical protein